MELENTETAFEAINSLVMLIQLPYIQKSFIESDDDYELLYNCIQLLTIVFLLTGQFYYQANDMKKNVNAEQMYSTVSSLKNSRILKIEFY